MRKKFRSASIRQKKLRTFKESVLFMFLFFLAMGDVCHPNPCDNKGKCNPGQDGKIFTCDCPVGYVGTRCECKFS